MSYMFYNAESFNQDISKWDVDERCNTDYMFEKSGIETEVQKHSVELQKEYL